MEVQSPGPTNVVPQNTSTSCAIPSSSEVSSVAISKTSINLENMDKECSALAGLFQQTVNDMKNGVPHYDELVTKAAKLHSNLKSTILVLSSFLDTFQKIADAATNTKGATREIGACLTRIVLRHKAMESRMKTLCSALLECMILPLQDKVEEWRKNVGVLDKDHAKEYKKIRSEVKKKWEVSNRLKKKNSKQQKSNSSSSEHLQKATDASAAEVEKSLLQLEETEKNAVRRALTEERSRYCAFVHFLRPVITEETGLVSEFQQLEEVSKRLGKHTEEPFKLPAASEQVIKDMKSYASGENGGQPAFNFQTPPSSPSSLGSRKSSMCSISSAGSGSTGTGSLHHSPSHHQGAPNKQSHNFGGNNTSGQDRSGQNPMGTAPRLRSHSQIHNTHNQVNQSNALGPMRLSSISSQDSGFTSQDTLFLQDTARHKEHGQNSPGAKNENVAQATGGVGMPLTGNHRNSSAVEHGTNAMQANNGLGDGLPLSDRPHTISSAYEKSGIQHQRPQLQPYTFNPPESTLTIPESCELSSSINDPVTFTNNQQQIPQQESNNRMQHQQNFINNVAQLQQQRRSLVGSHDSLPPPPPPPKPPKIMSSLHSRPGSAASNDGSTLSRPALPPGKTIAATMAAARQQQQLALLVHHEKQRERTSNGTNKSLPNFNLNKNDMVVPQPVYMNQNDLAEMAAEKQNNQQINQCQRNTENPGCNANDTCDDSQDLKTPTAENQQTLIEPKIVGDGSSSNSESSLGSSSGYGSQNTVKVDDINQQIQKQKQNRIASVDAQKQQPTINQNTHQHPTDGVGIIPHHTNHIPTPMILLDSSQYNTNYNETIVTQNMQQQYFRSQSHPTSSNTVTTQETIFHPSFQRPYSFTDGQVNDFVEIQGMSPTKMPTLRRGGNQHQQKGTNYGSRPNPPIRRTSSVASSSSDLTSPTHMLSASPPPPPAPQPHVAINSQYTIVDTDSRAIGSGNDGSNSTTPRGSMENLPPPPPDLLNSDDDELIMIRPNSRSKDHNTLISRRGISVAESVKALQQQGHTPCSPKSLRRAHSIAVPPSSIPGNQPRPLQKTSLSSVPLQNQFQHSTMSTQSKNCLPPYNRQVSQPIMQNNHHNQIVHTTQQQQQHQGMHHNHLPQQTQQQLQKGEEIYAPVAHLQQKMINQKQHSQLPPPSTTQPVTFSPGSPESTEYGFGVQFQHHQSQFYQVQRHNPQTNSNQYPVDHPEVHIQSSSATSSPHHANLYHPQHQQQSQQQSMYNYNSLSDVNIPISNSQQMLGNVANNHNQMYKTGVNHDKIMGESDVQLRHRPQPPPIATSQIHPSHPTMTNDPLRMSSAISEQTALRVRKWIESKSVSNVRDFRPILNAEIQQGHALRNTTGVMNDRSAPRF